MINGQQAAGIFMKQRERRAGRGCGRADGRGETFHELGFAGAELTG